MANVLSGRPPWHRDTRPGILSYDTTAYRDSVIPSGTERAEIAPFELSVASEFRQYFGSSGIGCLGGGATAAYRMTPEWQLVAEVSGYSYSDEVEILELASQRDEPPFILLLDSLNDPQNFGTLLRTAEAVGVHGVIIPLAHTVEVTPAVVNASSGASEHLLIARSNLAQAIEALKEAEVWIVGLDQAGASACS